MNAQASDLEVFRAVLAEHAAERAGEHPDHDALVAYLTGELDAEAEARLNDHLVACRACAATLLDLEPLSQPDAGMPEGVADLAAAAAWRDLRHRVFSEEPRARPAIGRHWSTAVAASLLVTTLGMSAWVARLSGTAADLRHRVADLSQPVVNMPIFYVGEVTRSAEVDVIEVPATSYFGLIFRPGVLEEYEEYEARFIDAEGEELPPIRRLKLEDGGLRLWLPGGFLPAGDYQILLSGFDGDRWQPIEEYRRRIVYLGSSPPR